MVAPGAAMPALATQETPVSPVITRLAPIIPHPPRPQSRHALLIGSTDSARGKHSEMPPSVKVNVEVMSRLLGEELPARDRFRVSIHHATTLGLFQETIAAHARGLAAVP